MLFFSSFLLILRLLLFLAGSAAVAQPQIDLSAFTAAANAATGMTLDPPFTYYANDINGLLSAYTFEDVGVTAYNGAVPLITSKALLAPAVGIGLIEGYHSGIVSINPCRLFCSTALLWYAVCI